MYPTRTLLAIICLCLVLFICIDCGAQVVVNGKNLNNDRELHYIQLMYYIDKSSIKPVFYLDYGFIEPEYNDILQPEQYDHQHITINGDEVSDRVSVVWVLNKLNSAGWEYMGDVVFVPLRVMNNWHVYTLKRK
jgi:hypothetical protein